MKYLTGEFLLLYVSDRVSVSPCGLVDLSRAGMDMGSLCKLTRRCFISPPACHGSTNEDPCLSLVATLNATVMRDGLCL